MILTFDRPTRTTAMIDDKEVVYDACHATITGFYDKKIWKHIGFGNIHTVGGVKQGGTKEYHFWIKK